MAKSYQLVAWTEKGQVRYGTYHEVGDILKVSSAYEKLVLNLQEGPFVTTFGVADEV